MAEHVILGLAIIGWGVCAFGWTREVSRQPKRLPNGRFAKRAF